MVTTFLIDHHHALMYLEELFKMYRQQITVSFHAKPRHVKAKIQ